MEKIIIEKYKAFDGKIFENDKACMAYEVLKKANEKVNLRSFEIVFPMQDQVTTCRAYFIPSPNAFDIFKAFVLNEYSEFDPTYLEYDGDGWYVVQSDDYGWARVEKLSAIIHDWCLVMDKIAQKTMDFKEV